MNIDFIKWMCEKAGGMFELTKWSDVYETMSFPIYEHSHKLEWWMKADLFMDVGYPLLLQRAIEGVNRKFEPEMEGIGLCIETDCIASLTESIHEDKCWYYSEYDSNDAAKEAALKWVWENEQIRTR